VIVFGCSGSGGQRRSNAAAALATKIPLTAANRINNQQMMEVEGRGASQEPQILLANLTVTAVLFLRYPEKVTVSLSQ